MKDQLLQHAISDRAQQQPDACALVFKDQRMSYRELEERSNRLAHLLISAGCEPGDRIALLCPKSPAAVVGMLGALKADTIYVPLDPSSPPERLARMLEAADCRFILAAGAVERVLHETLAVARIRLPLIGWLGDRPPQASSAVVFTGRDLAAYPATSRQYLNHAGNVAHILFTSGSTGVPKGVMITHGNVMSFLRWAHGHFGHTSGERISQHPPLHFDLSTFDIYGTLAAGGELHLIAPEYSLLPHKLVQYIRQERLNQWFSVPSVLNLIAKFDLLRHGDFPELRRLMWCGEAIPTPTLIYWMQRLPHVRFTNLYGPTEATIASSFFNVPECPSDERAAVPIGRACDGESLLVLDDERRPVPDGQTGHLYIAGSGLSPGYWRDPDKTAAVFVSGPAGQERVERIYKTGDLAWRDDQGLVHFVGRSDTQIKSRGYRIELGEIEAALHALPYLAEACVVAIQTDGFEGATLCAAYVSAPGEVADPERLRHDLTSRLPTYMLPMRWMPFDVLPKNGNGKIDRPALRRMFEDSASAAPGAPVSPPMEGSIAHPAFGRAAAADESPRSAAGGMK